MTFVWAVKREAEITKTTSYTYWLSHWLQFFFESTGRFPESLHEMFELYSLDASQTNMFFAGTEIVYVLPKPDSSDDVTILGVAYRGAMIRITKDFELIRE